MHLISSAAAVFFMTYILYAGPASAAAPEEVWIPKSSGGFHIIEGDAQVRVQFIRNGEINDTTGRITNLGGDKEFKGSYLRLATDEGTVIVLLRDIRFLESIQDSGQDGSPAPQNLNEESKSSKKRNQESSPKNLPKAIGVKLGGEIGSSPQGRPWFLSIVFETAIQEGVDTVLIEFDTPGGILNDGFTITSQILDARESGLTVIGWVKDALSAGARPALACDKLFVQPSARLGGAEWYSHGVKYEFKEINYEDTLYVYRIPTQVIYHRGNDYLPDRIRAKEDSYSNAIDRRLTQRSQIPDALIDAMSIMESELWFSNQSGLLSNTQLSSSDELVDDSTSVLTLNADQLVKFLGAKRASSIDEIANQLNITVLDGRDLPYRTTANASEIRKLKSNLKKSADFRILVNDVRDKLDDCFERATSIVDLSSIARREEDKRRARALDDWKASPQGRSNRPPPRSIRPLTGPPELIPAGRKLTMSIRQKVVACLSMAQKDYDLLEEQIKAMLGVNSVTEFVEVSRSIRTELDDPRTDVEFIEFVDVLADEVVEVFYNKQ